MATLSFPCSISSDRVAWSSCSSFTPILSLTPFPVFPGTVGVNRFFDPEFFPFNRTSEGAPLDPFESTLSTDAMATMSTLPLQMRASRATRRPSRAVLRTRKTSRRVPPVVLRSSRGGGSGASVDDFFSGSLPGKLGTLALLLLVSRVGVYIPLSGVDREAFAQTLQQGSLLGYVDTLAGGSISKVGLFSLGIVPYINSSIIFQLLASVFDGLKKLQKEEGEAGRRKFQQYQRYGALGFAVIQAVGQCTYLRPYVENFDLAWLASSSVALTAGAMILMYIGEQISELKLGNGTSLLIFANICSSLPTSLGQTFEQAQTQGEASIFGFVAAFVISTLGIVYVQEAERKIPINYASRYKAGGLNKTSYLPFKVNSTGVMPIIFSSSLMSAPAALARFTNADALKSVAQVLYPGGPLYLPVSIGLIAFFNYFYTFLQLDPKDVAEQLKRQGASIPGIRPGRSTEVYLGDTLERMSVLGSIFLASLAAAPAIVENITKLSSFRGFAGTSLLIMVGVATDTARRVRSELLMQQYDRIDNLYDENNKF